MYASRFGFFAPARFVGPVSFLCAAFVAASLGFARPAIAAAQDDHQQAVAALSDVKGAVAELVRADTSFATDKNRYFHASQRAINALVGTNGDGYVAGAGTPGDAAGALGHIDALLNRQATPVWVPPLHGAEANIRGAVVHLRDSLNAHELMDYEISASRALAYLEVAQGRPNETGVFGGLEGALANTELGVPAGAHQEDACGPPSAAPAYGTHGGWLAWVALPATDGVHALAEATGATGLTVRSGMIELHTAAAKLVASACDARAAASPHPPLPAPEPAAQAVTQPAPGAEDALPALYTKAQAIAGKPIFMSKCVTCHGANLQGTAAPSVAGTDFLTAAKKNGWTLWVVRYLVFTQMPQNAPGTLSPTQAADVVAFLLASDCYPAGKTPFPTTDEASFKKIKLAPVPGHKPGENDKGVCKVG